MSDEVHDKRLPELMSSQICEIILTLWWPQITGSGRVKGFRSHEAPATRRGLDLTSVLGD
jgi:hypothetical protein